MIDAAEAYAEAILERLDLPWDREQNGHIQGGICRRRARRRNRGPEAEIVSLDFQRPPLNFLGGLLPGERSVDRARLDDGSRNGGDVPRTRVESVG